MKKSKSYRPAALSGGQMMAVRLLLIVASGIAAYLAWASISGGTILGCGVDSDCDKVLQSRWAYWFGMPVSIPAMVVYVSLFMVTFAMPGPGEAERSWIPVVAGGLAIAILGGALWFIGLQIFVIHAYCKFCFAAHAAGAAAALILLRHFLARVQSAAKVSAAAAAPVRLAVGRSVMAGAAALFVLIAGQHVRSPEGYAIKRLDENGTTVAAPQQRVFPIHGGKFQLALHELPLIGPATAPNVIVSLFDYTCHFCRDLHAMLVQAQAQSNDQLAIVSLPMPLDANCNYLMTRTPAPHVNACEYARLGLAVWRAKPEQFREFDSWVFKPASPPPLDETRRYAEQLVGKEQLDKALADEWVNNQIRTDVAIFQANNQAVGGGGRMPQLIVGNAVVTGPVPRMERLQQLLEEQLGLKLPAVADGQQPQQK